MKRQKIFLLIILVMIYCCGITYKSYSMSKEIKIYKNIYIENIDVSGMTKKDAIKKLNKYLNKKDYINLLYGESKYNLKLDDIGFRFKIEDSVDKAIRIGRDSKFLENLKTKLNLKLGKDTNLSVDTEYNNEKLNLCIDNILKKIELNPINAKIKIKNNKFKIKEERYGIGVNKKELIRNIDINIKHKKFKDIDIHTERLIPKFTYNKLKKINTLLGSYETKFNLNNKNRSENIRLASKKLNGILIDSNEEFSFNNTIGRRSTEKGFKSAPIIINGEARLGMGGGICQVSSTLYNAAIYSGLDIVQVKNHTIPSSYIAKGRDATVSYGDIDLIFKNTFKSPILINNEIDGNKIIIKIYGNEEDKKIINIKTDTLKVIEHKTIEKESDSLYEGETRVQTKGRDGYKVNTYRIYKNKDGIFINKELINESYYPPKNEVFIKGTKKKVNNIKNKII